MWRNLSAYAGGRWIIAIPNTDQNGNEFQFAKETGRFPTFQERYFPYILVSVEALVRSFNKLDSRKAGMRAVLGGNNPVSGLFLPTLGGVCPPCSGHFLALSRWREALLLQGAQSLAQFCPLYDGCHNAKSAVIDYAPQGVKPKLLALFH